MNNVIYILAGIQIGAWSLFYKIGYKIGFTKKNNYYCDNMIRVFALKDMDELFDIWKGTEKSEPCIIVKPEKWYYFKR